MTNLEEIGKNVRAAARVLARISTMEKNQALIKLADTLWQNHTEILTANAIDLENGRSAGLSAAMLDRLMLNESRLQGIANDLRTLVDLPDPVGEIFDEAVLENGLSVRRLRVPLGVLAVIYESRPNVTIDVVGLAIKSGNGVILRGGSESIHSNRALVKAVREAFHGTALPPDSVQFIDDTDRALVLQLMKMYDVIDMLIPRGGASLHKFCRENSLVPVITGGIGICHLFVDESADLEAALPVIRNAKIQRPTVCNALDTVLVHRNVAPRFIPMLVDYLATDGVTFRADSAAMHLIAGKTGEIVQPAGPADFDTEWLSLVLGIRVVDGLDQAVEHIAAHSTAHSDGILTRSDENANRFIAEVDSAAVYVNASTRFTDGAQLGLGAEIAVSTQRLHARGPMGLRELTTYKWVIQGNYQVRP
jgi:glutamate-5-semialdehyde dehydrogenase